MTVWSGYVGWTGEEWRRPGDGGEWLAGERFGIGRAPVRKFAADQFCGRIGEVILLLDGVVYNRAELRLRYGGDTWADTVLAMYRQLGPGWCRELRGSFSGVVYDVASDELELFTDHIGDRRVFFYHDAAGIAFSSDLPELLVLLRRRGVSLSLDVNSAYSLLSFGFMLEDNSLVAEVRRLRPGQYLQREAGGRVERRDYYRLDNTATVRIGFRDAIDELDRRFRRAVQLEYDRDGEEGLRHLAGLSGGLDARMALWVARDMGYEDILSYTMGQSGCDDDRMARELAAWLRVEHLFKSLDHGHFLLALDEVTAINPGMFIYYGLAHNYSLFRTLAMDRFGLVHSGQLGDVVIGSFIRSYRPGQALPVTPGGVYSAGLSGKVRCDYAGFGNQELFLMYTRGFGGCLQGNSTAQYFGSEVASPFCDVDLIDFCFRLPLEYRVGHRLYFAWIKERYPDAARFRWTSQNRYIGDGPIMNFIHKFPRRAANQLLRLLRRPMIGSTFSRRHMNPLDLWYRDHADLRIFMDAGYERSLALLEEWPELLDDCRTQYLTGPATARVQVLTLLAGMERLWQPDNRRGSDAG